MPLAPHAELLQYAGGAGVPRLEAADDAMQTERLEGEREQRSGCLGRVPLSLMGRVNDETELTLAVRLAGPEQCEIGDELARLAENGRGAEPLALSPDGRPGDLPCEQLPRLLERPRVVVEPARDSFVGVDRVERREVVRRERAQDEPLGVKWPRGRRHRREAVGGR